MKNSQKGYIPALKYSWLTRIYDPFIKWTMPETAFKRCLVAQAQIEPAYNVLDLGCGTATLTILIKRLHPAANVIGIDSDPRILGVARVKIARAGLAIPLDQGMAFELPYPDGYFDRVFSSLVFHHLKRDKKIRTVAEVFRVLRTGGEFHIADLGKPQNSIMYVASLAVRLLEETSDNLNGLLPGFFHNAGFEKVEETAKYMSMFGTLSLYVVQKPGALEPTER